MVACAVALAVAGLGIVSWMPRAGAADDPRAQADVFVARAIVAYEQEKFEDALVDLGEALQLVPIHVDALYYRGLVLGTLGRLDEAVASLEKARARAPRDEYVLFQLGVLYIALKKEDQARPHLETAFSINPKLDSLGYYTGYLRYRRGDYQGALDAFRQGTTRSPEIRQLTHFYGGLALRSLGMPERGAAEFDEALRQLPPGPLTGPAERVRDAMLSARRQERPFRAELRLGVFYDDNVGIFPQASGDAGIQELSRRKIASFGEFGSLRLDYTFLRLKDFDLVATGVAFGTYNNNAPSFNIADLLGGFTGNYRGTLAGMPMFLTSQYTYDWATLGAHSYVQRHIVSNYASLAENASNLTTLVARYQYKDFLNESKVIPEEQRTGSNYAAGFSHLFRWEGDKYLLRLGYQWDFDDTKGQDWAYFGNRVFAGGQYTLPWGRVRLNYDFDVHIRDYRFVNVVLPTNAPGTLARFDTEFTHVFGVTVPLPHNLSLVAQYQYTDVRSNIDLYSYKRNLASLYLVWTY